jgi:hypothetical protein
METHNEMRFKARFRMGKIRQSKVRSVHQKTTEDSPGIGTKPRPGGTKAASVLPSFFAMRLN